MNTFRPYSVHLRTGQSRGKPKTERFTERPHTPRRARIWRGCVASAALLSACLPSRSGDPLFFPQLYADREGIAIHFGTFSDIAAEIPGEPTATFVPGTLPDPRAFAEQTRAASSAVLAPGPGVSFTAESGLLCLRNLNDFLFAFEAGLRLSYCQIASQDSAHDLREYLENIQTQSTETPTAYRRFRGDRIQVQVQTAAEIRNQLGEIFVSIDGARAPRLARWRLESERLRFAYSSFYYQSIAVSPAGPETTRPVHALPRRFPAGDFFGLISADAIYLAYELPHDPDRLLVVSIHDRAAAHHARAALDRLPEILALHIRASDAHRIAISEIFFRAQSLLQSGEDRPDEFFEIAAGSKNAFAQVSYATDDGAFVSRPIFLFSHSTLLFERDADLRLQRRLRYRAGRDEPEQNFELTSTIAPGRSYSFTNDALRYTDDCRQDLNEYRRLCANPGVTPELARAFTAALESPTTNEGPRDCDVADFALTEFNPTGMFVPAYPAGALEPDGKFVEFRALRDCRAHGILFRVKDTILDPGAIETYAGLLLVFVAAREPNRSLAPGPENTAHVISAPALRSAGPTDSIAIFSTQPSAQSPNDQKPNERSLRSAAPETAYWTGTGDAQPGAVFRAVHSLRFSVSTDELTPGESFAQGAGLGLRPDLVAANAMSPGVFPEQAATATNATRLRVRISEILPAGGYSSDSTPLADEEFIEFLADRMDAPNNEARALTSGTWQLQIRRIAATATTESPAIIKFPAPERPGYFVFQRGVSRCFTHTPADRFRFPALSLPNTATRYELRSRSTATNTNGAFAEPTESDQPDETVDAVTIDAGMYARLDQTGRRFSVSRNLASDGDMPEMVRLTDGAAASSPFCGAGTFATPAAPAAFAPFLFSDPRTQPNPALAATPRRLRLYSELGTLPLRIAVGETLNDAQTFERDVAPGQEIWIAPDQTDEALAIRNPRTIFRVSYGERVLAAGEIFFGPRIPLIVQSVAPTPASGDVEWIRLCSPDGFSPDAQIPGSRLFVRDANGSDQIIPFRTRHPEAPPGGLIDDTLELAARTCALLVDPDYGGQALPFIAADRALWTIADSTAIGNGLSSGEGLYFELRHDSQPALPICAYGRPDLPDPYQIHTGAGQYVTRVFDPTFARVPQNIFDEAEFFAAVREERAP